MCVCTRIGVYIRHKQEARKPVHTEGEKDLIHVACFWKAISGLSICQKMMHGPGSAHCSCCHPLMYAKARCNTAVQINSTITPSPLLPPTPTRLKTESGTPLSPPMVYPSTTCSQRDIRAPAHFAVKMWVKFWTRITWIRWATALRSAGVYEMKILMVIWIIHLLLWIIRGLHWYRARLIGKNVGCEDMAQRFFIMNSNHPLCCEWASPK